MRQWIFGKFSKIFTKGEKQIVMQNSQKQNQKENRPRSVLNHSGGTQNGSPDFARMTGVLLILVSLLSLAVFSVGAWKYFLEKCPNTDVLTWDENIRLITVYDQYSDLQNGRIVSGLKPFLEAPTWPPLRSFITFILLFFPDFLLVTQWDSLVGHVFLLGAYLSLVFIGYKLTKNWLYTGILSLSGFALLFHTIEVSAYSLSSMLETQAMFFLLWCYYYFYRFYEEWKDLKKGTIIGLTTFLLCFFFTKYPYGLMLFMAVLGLECFRNLPEIQKAIGYAFQHHYKGVRLFLIVFVAFIVLSIPFLRFLEGVNFNQKSFKISLYFLSLPVFLDFQYFLWKYRKDLGGILPRPLKVVYLYSFLPAMVWIYTNPDRVSSLLDAQMIVNTHTKSFFLSIVATRSENPMLPMAVFDDPLGIRILLLAALLSSLFLFLQSMNKTDRVGDPSSPESKFFQSPLFLITLLLFLQILILETTTGNKQQRHILQYLPSLILILWLWIFRARESFLTFAHRKNRFGVFIADFPVAIVFLITISVLAGKNGLWAGNFFQERYFCLRGEDPSVFEPVRWADSILPKDKNLMLFNGFHESFHFDKKGRLIASEFDLKIRESRYDKILVRNDNRHKWESWSQFDELILISYSCEDLLLLEKLRSRAEAVKASLTLIARYRHPSGEYCVERFQIQ